MICTMTSKKPHLLPVRRPTANSNAPIYSTHHLLHIRGSTPHSHVQQLLTLLLPLLQLLLLLPGVGLEADRRTPRLGAVGHKLIKHVAGHLFEMVGKQHSEPGIIKDVPQRHKGTLLRMFHKAQRYIVQDVPQRHGNQSCVPWHKLGHSHNQRSGQDTVCCRAVAFSTRTPWRKNPSF